jgi:DNA-binding CsgD family transcriptional regulator
MIFNMEIDEQAARKIPEAVSALFRKANYREFRSAVAPVLAGLVRADRYRVMNRWPAEPRAEPRRCTVRVDGHGRRGLFIVIERSSSEAGPFSEAERAALHFAGELIHDEFRRRNKRPRSKAGLSPREKETADLIRQGLSNRDTAIRLGISEETVKRHLYNIFNKIGAESRTHLLCILRDMETG